MPNIPDKLYKLIILIGLFLLGYSYIKNKENYNNYESVYLKYDDLSDSLELLKLEKYFEQENFKKACREIEIKHDLDSIYIIREDQIIFSKILSANRDIQSDIQSLEKQWIQIRNLQHKEELLNLRIDNSASDHNEAKEDLFNSQEEIDWMQFIGLILIFIGIASWVNEEKDKPKDKIRQFEKIYRRCQSCGNSFNSLRHYGKNQDGSFNLGLCHECYNNGSLIESDLTKESALERYCSKNKVTKGIPKYLTKRLFKKLERWT